MDGKDGRLPMRQSPRAVYVSDIGDRDGGNDEKCSLPVGIRVVWVRDLDDGLDEGAGQEDTETISRLPGNGGSPA